MMLRGGTSKGAYFLAGDLPTGEADRDDLLLRIMGSPDPRQIDGLGGGHPLTSKVAVVSRSARPDADVDYLFLQVAVETAAVSARQNCGNLLAGVGPFALERRLIPPGGDTTRVRIHMVNTGGLAVAHVPTPGGTVRYSGATEISGAPHPAAAIALDFTGTQGSTCGALLPTGSVRDVVDALEVTCADNGMPVVLVRAGDVGVSGYESPEELEGNPSLRDRLEGLRLRTGRLMNLGDVTEATVPKMTLVAPPVSGGTLCTRTFIPRRCHPSIGVLAAVSVATAAAIDGTVAADLIDGPSPGTVRLEHPTGFFDAQVVLEPDGMTVARSGVIRTARKLFDGITWPWEPERRDP
jgi:4-oxalomesaconate tautomerase